MHVKKYTRGIGYTRRARVCTKKKKRTGGRKLHGFIGRGRSAAVQGTAHAAAAATARCTHDTRTRERISASYVGQEYNNNNNASDSQSATEFVVFPAKATGFFYVRGDYRRYFFFVIFNSWLFCHEKKNENPPRNAGKIHDRFFFSCRPNNIRTRPQYNDIT